MLGSAGEVGVGLLDSVSKDVEQRVINSKVSRDWGLSSSNILGLGGKDACHVVSISSQDCK
jgi:hypothetical protein